MEQPRCCRHQRDEALLKLGHDFFQQPAITLAPALLGTILVRNLGRRQYRVRIVETEAYVGSHDLACHAAKGRTARTETMFGPGGRTYVYLIYGMYHMLNIVCSVPDDPQAVLIRGAVSLDNSTSDLLGPGKLARGLFLTREQNNLDVTSEAIHFLADDAYQPRIRKTKRIGIDYAGVWKNRLLRFIDLRHVKK